MASVNKAIILGNVGKDPETRYAADGSAVTNLSIATSEQWKDKATGEKQEKVEWHRVVFFGKVAEVAGQYLKKGSSCYVEGKIVTRKWTDKEGQDRYSTEIVGDRLQLLGGKPQGDAPQESQKPRGSAKDMDSDIPFANVGRGRAFHSI